MVPAKDISRYQGAWQNTSEPIVLIKMSGGDAGLYMDSQAASNYSQAKKAGKAVGGYHFIGWVLGATREAAYFLQAMSPVAENDVFALDIEAIKPGINPVSYVTEMVAFIHSKIKVYPLLYMNLATLRAYDWSELLKLCGLWLADWNNDPAATIPNVPTYVMQQYNNGPSYDHDEWFGTLESFKEYGYHSIKTDPIKKTTLSQTSAPVPSTAPTAVSPASTAEPIPPKITEVISPIKKESVDPQKSDVNIPITPSNKKTFWQIIKKFLQWLIEV